ncbi:MAG: cupin domain-containing protein [Candidatus Riflebacteria bacterium]|nr:cupin domain-containing protein [Candidatus Riflebacteria bacterium]
MSILVADAASVRPVSKPWGYEKWIAPGRPDFPYVLKEIFIRAPHRSSLQFHQQKQESNYVLSGQVWLHYSDTSIDIERYKRSGYEPEELGRLLKTVCRVRLGPGSIFHVRPGYLHRVEAVEDLLMVETSTTELDDVFRLADDAGRPHGRIDAEHSR